MLPLAITADTSELVMLLVTAAGAAAAATKLVWTWLTKLVDRFQDDAAAMRTEFVLEARDARHDFLSGLEKLENARLQAHRETLVKLEVLSEGVVSIKDALASGDKNSPKESKNA